MTRILIADDNPRIRTLVREQLAEAGVENCVEAKDGIEAIEKSSELRPDLVILDVTMPRLNGMDAASRLRKLHPKVIIILYTLHAAVILSQGLPQDTSDVVQKGEPLVPRLKVWLDHLAKSAGAIGG